MISGISIEVSREGHNRTQAAGPAATEGVVPAGYTEINSGAQDGVAQGNAFADGVVIGTAPQCVETQSGIIAQF